MPAKSARHEKPRLLTARRQFLGVAMAGFVALLLASLLLLGGIAQPGTGAGLLTYGVGMAIAWRSFTASYHHGALGLCNIVTIVRLALVGLLVAALVSQSLEPWVLVAIAAIALVLDGADGWLARWQGFSSNFGARFDMEVDSALALTLALHGVISAGVGPHILLLGLPRYVFAVAQFAYPWLGGALPPRFSRKVVCVLQLSVLIIVLVPIVPLALSNALVGVAALALAWSFWGDVAWLRRSRA